MTRGEKGYEAPDPETSVVHITPPFESVVSLPPLVRPEQFEPPRLVNVNPLSLIPDAKVEVAVVVEMLRTDA